ncbi:transcriptional repressor TCF25-domain-containing protein [Podospora fimiseda]|uniref:Transcriptional repressor TCF25-domain-containing protein n=1 Tax=Podospora fimiseda TaxID=252190 RepID=A0AAN7GX90_9PEZI|nr:transcriptional repressor TCF25-domain-containing protein [Podospora fimiseda]
MASRQLRKLRQQQEAFNLERAAASQDEESEEEPVVAKPRPNMFSGFAALGGMDNDNDDEEDEDDDQPKQEEQKSDDDEQPAPKDVTSAPKKNKKSKKKKKKGKQANASAAPTKEDSEPENDIDRVLAELKLQDQQTGESSSNFSATQSLVYEEDRLAKLLSINFQHLKYMNEMRRLFGKAMDVADVEERTQENRHTRHLPDNLDLETFLSARAAQGEQARSGMFETLLRTNPFIEGKKHWPRGGALGLKMARIAEKGKAGAVEFTFTHDKSYERLEGHFFGLVLMLDPMQVVHFLYDHPYHISSLIQVSKVARQDQNPALAADLIDRALFTFGRVTLSEFRKKLEQGKARLDFNRPENRQFWLAGWNLIQKLTMKGTYRTALEWAKLLLSLSADDPYGIINWIHVLAIRAHEAQWFIDLCKNPLFRLNLIQSPINYMRQTLPLAYLQLDDYDNAKYHLIEGIESFPWLYCALCSKINIDAPKSVWGVQPPNEDEALHTELYIHMAKDLWNTAAAILLLKDAAALVKHPESTRTSPKGPLVSLATARFVYLDDTPTLLTRVPRGMIHNASPNYDFDPLPPSKGNNIFSSETQKRPWDNERFRISDFPRGNDVDAGIRAAAQRLLEQFPPEHIEQAIRAGGGGNAIWNRLFGGQGPAARDNAEGGGGGERQPRGQHQAFVEDAEDEGEDEDGGNDDWESAEEGQDDEHEEGDDRSYLAGIVGRLPRWVWESIAGSAINPEFAGRPYDEDGGIGFMPGAWDSEDQYEHVLEGEDEESDDEMPDLEDPDAGDLAGSGAQNSRA